VERAISYQQSAVRGKRFRPRASARGRQARMPVLPRPRFASYEPYGRGEGLGPSPTYAPRAYTACRVGYTACRRLLGTGPDPGGEAFWKPERGAALRAVGEGLAQGAGAGAATGAAEALLGIGEVGGADGAVKPAAIAGRVAGGNSGVGNNGGHRRGVSLRDEWREKTTSGAKAQLRKGRRRRGKAGRRRY